MLLDDNKNDDFTFDDGFDDLNTIDISESVKHQEKEAKENNDREHSVLYELFSYLKILCIAIVIALITNNFIIINATVPTGSMTNTILEGDRLIGFRFSYLFSEPQRGDIIIFKWPDDPSEKFVKRVIGLPGDCVEIKKEADKVHVYVNGEMLNEPYLREEMYTAKDYTFLVPADSYFVMGDNRNDSKDSRYWTNTYVPKENIIAKAIFKYYSTFKSLTTKYY